MTHDEVNNPEHYNQQGIEVIDVIEAYELPYHLGNVIKYVLRHSYKGKPLQDLQKALWYLTRYVEDLEDVTAVEERDDEETFSLDEAMAFIKGYDYAHECIEKDEPDFLFADEEHARDCYGRALRASPPVNIDGDVLHPCARCAETLDPDLSYMGEPGVDAVCDPCFGSDEETEKRLREEQRAIDNESVVDSLYVRTSPSRIAGDTDTATRIKNGYYNHNPFEIVGWCAYCDAELEADDNFLEGVDGYDKSVKFCGVVCVSHLRAWQGRAK